MQEKFLGVPWLIWAIVAIVVVALYAFVIPNSKITPSTTGIQLLILRWFHPLVWVLLAMMFLMRSKLVPGSTTLANSIGLAGLMVYITFMITLARS